jgi:hypothetical protein
MKIIKTFESFLGGTRHDSDQNYLELVQLMIDNPAEIKLTGGETDDNFINFSFNDDEYTLSKDHKSLSFGYSEDSGHIAYVMPKSLFRQLRKTLEDVIKDDIRTSDDAARTEWEAKLAKFNAQPTERLNRYKNRKIG